MTTTDLTTMLTQDLGLTDMPEAERTELIDNIIGLVLDRVMERALDMMSENDKNEMDEKFDAGMDGEGLFAFLSEKIPSFNSLVHEQVIAFKREALDTVDYVQKSLGANDEASKE